MEYNKYLTKNLVYLVQNTTCNKMLLDYCIQKAIFAEVDKDQIEAELNRSNRSSEFWHLAMKRKCLDGLIDIFGELNQQHIVDILIRAVRDDGSDSKYNFMKNLTKLTVRITKPQEMVFHQNDGYNLKNATIGYALVLNAIDYDRDDKKKWCRRHGAAYDSEYMNDLWTQLGYKTTLPTATKFTSEDVSRHVDQLVENAVQYPQQSLVVFIGCHGENGSLIMSDLKPMKIYDDVVFKFDIPELANKPKIFIFQCCQYFPENGNAMTQSIYDRLNKMENTVICFSTLPGQESTRDFFLGSYYIYTLTDIFMREAYRTELVEMLNMVQKKMAIELKSEQIPYHYGPNLKPLYFNVQP